MGREVRMVPANWQHPKDSMGRYEPLLGSSYQQSVDEWDAANAQWKLGIRPEYCQNEDVNLTYEQWAGQRPHKDEYMPEWSESERTHLMMYEDTSEGTPISPAFTTPEELAHWLADNGASSFGNDTATYEQWLATIKCGFAVSAVFSPQTGLISGVAANAIDAAKET